MADRSWHLPFGPRVVETGTRSWHVPGGPRTLETVSTGGGEISGSLSTDLDTLTGASTGTVDVAGTLSQTLADLTGTSTGVIEVAGTLATNLENLTHTATGTLDIGGALTTNLEVLTGTATGTVALSGSLTTTLEDATLVASTSSDILGTLSTTLEDVALGSAGTVSISGTLTSTLDAVTGSGTGELSISGSLDQTLEGATLSAEGVQALVGITGDLSVSLADVTSTFTGTVSITGSANVNLEAASLNAAGNQVLQGQLSISLEGLDLSATGIVGDAVPETRNGEVAVLLAPLTGSATGTVAGGVVTPPVDPGDPSDPCSPGFCGTGIVGPYLPGEGAAPKPGDPDNQLSISARTVYGGIVVAWTYPSLNPHAVAHSKVYRSPSSSFANAIEISIASGNTYFDKLEPVAPTAYYYWIRIVSVNGTVNSPIGPAVATAQPLGQQTLETLTGLIDAGVLAQSLKTTIDKITLNKTDLDSEIARRVAGDTALSQAVANVQSGLTSALGLIYTETATRTNGQNALALQMSTIAALNQTNTAAILSEQIARVTATDALALQANSLLVASDETAAAVQDIQAAKIGYAVLAGTSTPYDGNGTTIVYPVSLYPSVTYPEYAANRTRIIDKEGVTNWNKTSAGVAKPLQWIVGLPLATAVKTVQVSGPGGELASVEQAFTAQKTLNDGLKAQYTVKVDVNGLVGGFGIYNNGATVEAGFDVDRFWIGRTNTNKVKPFIIDNDVVYINKARIRDADIDTLKIAGNAVTVPHGASALLFDSTTLCGASITITIPVGQETVPWMINYSCGALAYSNGGNPGSMLLQVSIGNGVSPTMLHATLAHPTMQGTDEFNAQWYYPAVASCFQLIPNGSGTYTLYVRHTKVNATYLDATNSITALQVKR